MANLKLILILLGASVKVTSYPLICSYFGEPQVTFKPSRGICKNDILSPYLFILCVKALSCFLDQAKSMGSITSVHIGKGLVWNNHLFFTNDSLLFCKAKYLDWSRLLHILKRYERALGLVLNKEKTSMLFSKNTLVEIKHNIITIAGVKATSFFENYLGLPSKWVRQKPNPSKLLLSKHRTESLTRKHSSYQLKGGKYFSRQSSKQSLHILWGFSSSPKLLLPNSTHSLKNYDGV